MGYKFKVGRDSKTGRFISIETAQRRKSSSVIETMKVDKKK